MVPLYLALIAFDFLAMVATLALIGGLTPQVRRPGIGRLIFFSLLTIKLWVALALGWFTAVLAVPGLPLRAVRDYVYLGLFVYLALQATGVFVALVRWRRRRDE